MGVATAVSADPVAVRADEVALLDFGEEIVVTDGATTNCREVEKLRAADVIEVDALRWVARVAVGAGVLRLQGKDPLANAFMAAALGPASDVRAFRAGLEIRRLIRRLAPAVVL